MTALQEHMARAASTVCRLWRVMRKDGLALGFTDHDRDLWHQGLLYRADAGLSAGALQQSTGLAVDNAEAIGALTAEAISEADLRAGRYDGAQIELSLLNWAEPEQFHLLFRGALGEVSYKGGAFRAELRGLADLLNQPKGLIYARECSAILGDQRCRFDVTTQGYAYDAELLDQSQDGRLLSFAAFDGFAERWFDGGHCRIGESEGAIKSDRLVDGLRKIELWQALSERPALGARAYLTAGCDKRAETCRLKFGNYLNFRGFPHLPGEDWLMRAPK